MEVIIRGTIPGEREHVATCRTCRSVIKFREAEGRARYSQREGKSIVVVCPVCNQTIEHNC